MRIFVGEYICGGGLSQQSLEQFPSGLRMEGEAMLRSIVTDLLEVSEVVVPLDARLHLDLESSKTVDIDPEQALWGQWIAAARECDAAVIVAPESDGVLAKAAAMLRAGGIDVIASSKNFLRVASDKLLTAKTMFAAGVTHPIYFALSDRRFEQELENVDRFVLKPRDGCGTDSITTHNSLQEAREQLTEDLLLQAWMSGQPISIAAVSSGGELTFLPAVSQQIDQATCQYAGGQGPLDDDSQRRATALAARAIAAMPPGARGFIGLDLLLGSRPSEDCVIEINPRLTTSYVGLRRMINGNLAARLFDLESGPVSCHAAANSVRWSSDGRVWINDMVADPT